VAGIVLGIFILGPLGIIFGPFLGAVAGEIIAQKPLSAALRSGVGTIIGMVGGMAFKLVVQAGMIIWFVTAIR